MTRLGATICAFVAALAAPAVAAAEAGDAAPPAGPRGSRHVVGLLQPALPAIRQCLGRGAAEGEERLAEVLVRLEFPGGRAPTVVALDAWPGSAVDRCVREGLAGVATPAYAGPVERHECLIPLEPAGLLRCRPAGVGPLAPAGPPPAPPGAAPATPPSGGPAGRPRPNSITLNPLGVVVGGVDLKYTRALPHSSVGAGLVLQVPVALDDLGALGLVEVLGWLGDRPLRGLYAGVDLVVGGLLGPRDAILVSVLGVVGHRWVFSNGMTIGVGGALGYAALISSCTAGCAFGVAGRTVTLDAEGRGGGLAARLSLDLGFAF